MMVESGLLLFPRSPKIINFQKNRTPNRIKTPISSIFFGLGLLFWVWNRTVNLLARTTRNYPGRMNTTPEQETCIICVTYVRTKGHRYTPRHYNYLRRRAGPCGEAMPTRGRGKGRLSHAAEDSVLYADAGALCVCAFFFLRPVSKKGRRAVGSGATHAYISLHRTARPTNTLPLAPRWRRLTAIEAAAKTGKVMRPRVGRVQMQHR